MTDFIKKHDQQIKVYNPVSSSILSQTTSFGFEMIYNFSKIIFCLLYTSFPFNMFPEVDPILGPEMRSTGEVLGCLLYTSRCV